MPDIEIFEPLTEARRKQHHQSRHGPEVGGPATQIGGGAASAKSAVQARRRLSKPDFSRQGPAQPPHQTGSRLTIQQRIVLSLTDNGPDRHIAADQFGPISPLNPVYASAGHAGRARKAAAQVKDAWRGAL